MESSQALRKSIFPGVPPFINFVPIGGFTGKPPKTVQFWISRVLFLFWFVQNPSDQQLIWFQNSPTFCFFKAKYVPDLNIGTKKNGIKTNYGDSLWPWKDGSINAWKVRAKVPWLIGKFRTQSCITHWPAEINGVAKLNPCWLGNKTEQVQWPYQE